MPRATCRCGQALSLPDDGTERIICPKCGAKVRIWRSNVQSATTSTDDDGFIRFNCPCGRRLKVGMVNRVRSTHGKCPDCGRVVPVPTSGLPVRDLEAPTEEMAPDDVQRVAESVEAPSRRPREKVNRQGESSADKSPWTSEAGLRVCPGCGRPVHLGASVCRGCGSAVPKR